MEDREVVAAIVAGDHAALGEAYDRYAMPLFAYCRSMLREPADAADAVQDTFVTAVYKLGGLRDPGKLRSWLYAVARNECLRRLRTGHVTSALEQAADLPVDSSDIGSATERAELRQLVRDAIDGLNPSEREVIELSLGHGLDVDDLAAALGVPRNHAHAMLSRARRQLERSLGALIVARTGRQACAALEAILTDWDGQMTVLMRKRVSRHIERCEICGERKRRELSPALFGVGLPLVALMPGLREQVMTLLTGHTPAALAHKASVLSHAGRFGPAGFPRPVSPPGAPAYHWAVHHSHGVLAGAATSAAAVAVVFAVLGVGLVPPHAHGAGPGGAARQPNAAQIRGGISPGSVRSPGGTGLAPSASGMATASVAPTSTVTSGSASTPAVAATSGTAPAPGPTITFGTTPSSPPVSATPSSQARGQGTLTISPTTVNLAGSTGSFTLTATGGRISHFNITVRSAHELTVSPSAGSLDAGESVTVTVTAATSGAINTWIVINPGGSKVTVTSSANGPQVPLQSRGPVPHQQLAQTILARDIRMGALPVQMPPALSQGLR